MILPWILCGVLLIIVIILMVKIYAMQKSMGEICSDFTRSLKQDTNVIISVSSRDRYVLRLAKEINANLIMLRKQQLQYLSGDKELKDAITNISHDLRTPLTAICGYIDLLEREDKSENASRYIRQIYERAEVLKQLTEELFSYSIIASVPELSYEEVNINRILEESLLSFYGEMEKAGIQPVINMPDTVVCKRLDPSALMRIFNNIISNAIKYSDGDFLVKMSDDGKIVFSNSASKLSSVETGKLFDRFYTVDSGRKSTGLGLSIAKLLTERMGGSIGAVYENGSLYITIKF